MNMANVLGTRLVQGLPVEARPGALTPLRHVSHMYHSSPKGELRVFPNFMSRPEVYRPGELGCPQAKVYIASEQKHWLELLL
jgi:hypothetical protein